MGFDPYLLAVKGVRGLKPYEAGKAIDDIRSELGLNDIIKLASNENPLGCSPVVIDTLNKIKQLSRYPDSNANHLKKALSVYLDVCESQLTIGNGSNDVLELLVKAFVNPGEKVIISEHAFAVYYLASQAADAKIAMVPAINWGHDLIAMSEQVDETTKIVFIANPNNPTGTFVGIAEIHAFLDRLPESLLVVIDEAYLEYATDSSYASVLSLLSAFPNLVITRTFSKVYGLASLRVGYSISTPEIASLLNRVRQPFNANSMAQAAALAALSDQTFVETSVDLNSQQKQRLYNGFDTLGLDYIDSQGNFICVQVGDEQRVYEKMLAQGVIVRPVGVYQMPGYLRFSIGLEQENKRALNALRNAL